MNKEQITLKGISKKIIYIDIDGILTNETDGHDYKNRTPNIENINICNRLWDNNNIIVLYTARYKCDYLITKKWLKKNNVKYNKLKMGKPKYDLFIDDKAHNSFKGA